MERKNKKTKSVGNGEGSLYYSETLQAWIFQYVVNGSRKTIKQKKNEKVKDFKARATKIKNEINTNSYIANSTTSLYEILFNYIENNYKTGIISDRTHKRHSETLKLLSKCCNDFINKPIQKVTLLDVKNSLPNFVELKYICPKTNENKSKLYSQNVIDKLIYAFKERL